MHEGLRRLVGRDVFERRALLARASAHTVLVARDALVRRLAPAATAESTNEWPSQARTLHRINIDR